MATICQTRIVPTRTATPPQLSIVQPVPNKHLAFIPTPSTPTPTSPPPATPPSASQVIETSSLTFPPHSFEKIIDQPPVYSISGAKLAQALEHVESQPLPSTKQVFPWLHGLHAENQLQLGFFTARKKALRRTPKCIRGLTIIKAGGDLSHSRIKGAIAPEEILKPWRVAKAKNTDECDFLDIDPKEGFSVRNFQIQACKMATVSDIVVYGDERTPRQEVEDVARRISTAQAAWQKRMDANTTTRLFNTFVLSGKHRTVYLEEQVAHLC